jgi:uncharacterized membrane-anchored protein
MMPRILVVLGAVLVFGTVNWQIAGKERLRSSGQVVYLELAPVDPRSLMQGDYMALNFRLAQQIATAPEGSHVAIVKLDDRRVVSGFERLDTGGPVNPGEMRFRFRIRNVQVWLGTNAFFFHEGEQERYRNARYGEFRVNEDGDAMLVDLRDKDLRPM